MRDFESSSWAKPEFAQGFVDAADNFIPLRRPMMGMLRSFYGRFIQPFPGPRRILELGSGHGAHSHELLKIDPQLDATLVDGSEHMLQAAKDRLADYPHVRLEPYSFQRLLETNPLPGSFHFIFSAMAIHHLALPEKQRLFEYALQHLEPKGWFMNIDVSLAPAEALETWYLERWREQILELEKRTGQAESQAGVIERYKRNPDDKPDSLWAQLSAMREAGFAGVDCVFKDGVFIIYCGQKQ